MIHLEINLILHPGSLSANYQSKYTYHYFHLPFQRLIHQYSTCEDNYTAEFRTTQLFIRLFPWMRLTKHNPTQYAESDQRLSMNPPIPLTLCALEQIKLLESTYPVVIKILPPPVHESWKTKDLSSITQVLHDAQLKRQSIEYENKLEFWGNSEDWLDNAHFRKDAQSRPNNWLNILN